MLFLLQDIEEDEVGDAEHVVLPEPLLPVEQEHVRG